MAKKVEIPLLGLTAQQVNLIKRGLNPFEYSMTRSYARIKVRKKRLRNPNRKPNLKILGRRDVK